jgi:hypothetical protein
MPSPGQAASNAVAAAEAAVRAPRQLTAAEARPRAHGRGLPAVMAAAAKVREAYLALQRTRLIAPVDGFVAKRGVQLGQRVAAGSPLLTVVDLHKLWVDANFKESQLADLRMGQKVELTADVYGDKTVYEGKVVGLGAGTGAAFSLLPAQNATGNWIKVVQRAGAHQPEPEAWQHTAARGPVHGREGRYPRQGRPALASTRAEPVAQTTVYDGAWPRPAAHPRIIAGRRACALPAPVAVSARPRQQPGCAVSRPVPERSGSAMTSTAHPAIARGRASPPPTRPPAMPPAIAAQGRAAGPGHAGAVAGHLHERAGLLHRQRGHSGHLGRCGRQPQPGHLGHHQLRCGQCHLRAADRLAHPALRRGALFTMSVLLFVLTSWLCGFASSLEMLVLFRVLQAWWPAP